MAKIKYVNDNRTVEDWCNIFSERDYNQSRVTSISKQFYDSVIQKPECLTCKLHLEKVPPPCLNPNYCKFKSHIIEERDEESGKTKGRINIELRSINGYSVVMMRSHFVLCYILNQLGYPFIFRPGNDIGFHIHHINFERYDDRPENLVLLSCETHSWIHNVYLPNFLNPLRNQLEKYNYEALSITDKGSVGKRIRDKWEKRGETLESIMKKIQDIHTLIQQGQKIRIDQASIDILNAAKSSIERNIIFEPIGITKRINRYIEKGNEIRKREIPRRRKGIIYAFENNI